jgi:hypothetical protein
MYALVTHIVQSRIIQSRSESNVTLTTTCVTLTTIRDL